MKIGKYCAILGNALGTHELNQLVNSRPLATLPFDGKYRLIDFQLSNLVNAGVTNICGVFSQKNVPSVLDHIRTGREWGLNSLLNHFFVGFYNNDDTGETVTDPTYYPQLLTFLRRSHSVYTIFSTADVLCNINLEQLIHVHEVNQRTMSVVYKKMPKEQMSSVNSVLDLDETDTVSDVKDYDASRYGEDDLIAMSTGIYIINTDFLISLMEVEQYEAAPRKIRFLLLNKLVELGALGYEYAGYMKNIHDVKSYYDANMDMLDPQKFTSLLHATQKVYTKVKNEEATYFANSSEIFNSQFASGSVIEGRVENSIISRRCHLDKYASIKDAIIFPNVKIGEGARVAYAILDKEVEIAPGVQVIGTKEKPIIIEKFGRVTEDRVL
ncbi:glucose-1-phosphate adenylyltransferase subunit GlgD [Pseudolactococcus chungangensis]|jgi:glucose-1-phosphate adenylyltransferase, GlgD subunit|uniref:Glucose-1-phosphate adenylyltransferase n=2 Tax=Pseudolactococcus chungangensis TaxID=451457 RepID=A0A1K2H7V3_9LACT|nr:glucose-1-phosphate adenylyltransferase subunit GlgD [Lactococcus chungangensis]NCB81615.1 glucose-1-phosphate adenylyltransferase subunit GlgD [Bacilli bacterium]NLH34638.1 glucose-1-phosphate adenylyltransferase subunit GlgD [Lactococcus chungangensis]SFZ71908.1 glucose-1-phosphate adenylyltransferase [Lactococcus chungangensis CAU 28 = DSM 22330]